MSVIKEVLKEEIERLERKIFSYEKLLSNLPRGTIFIRKMGNASYAYRKRKENGKVKTIYLGNIEKEDTKKEIELSNEYKRIISNIRATKNELLKLKKAIKLYNWKRTV